MPEDEIRCTKCHLLLGKLVDGKLEVIRGGRALRVYGNSLVCLDCPRCGRTREVILSLGAPPVCVVQSIVDKEEWPVV